MKTFLLILVLFFASLFAGYSVFSSTPRRIVLGWIGVGICQSIFLLVIGFELLCLLNLLFVIASATVLQIYSAIFGTGAVFKSEQTKSREDWIHGIGAGLTLVSVLVFAFVSTFPEGQLGPDLENAGFTKEILVSFPEFPWAMGFILFLAIVAWGTIGRPAWKATLKDKK